jgi:hypothetical protein
MNKKKACSLCAFKKSETSPDTAVVFFSETVVADGPQESVIGFELLEVTAPSSSMASKLAGIASYRITHCISRFGS